MQDNVFFKIIIMEIHFFYNFFQSFKLVRFKISKLAGIFCFFEETMTVGKAKIFYNNRIDIFKRSALNITCKIKCQISNSLT